MSAKNIKSGKIKAVAKTAAAKTNVASRQRRRGRNRHIRESAAQLFAA